MEVAQTRTSEAALDFTASVAALERASQVLARGTASAARLRSERPSIVMSRAEGATVTDLDGNEYIDYVLGLGPAILGHRPAAVVEAVGEALANGWAFGTPHAAEAQLGERLVEAIPSAETVALVSTGSEAVHLAVRISRLTTNRRRIVKFDGHYHGWIDPLFVNAPWSEPVAGSPSRPTHNVPGEAPPDDVTVIPWNSLEDLDQALGDGPAVAAVVMEPIPCNFGTLLPDDGYLAAVKRQCDRHGALLVFDEVLTGFRMALGGAQERLGVTPDLTICSKAVASGLPLALVAGSAEAMAAITEGPIKPAGTFNGSPPSVAAALATLAELTTRRGEIYPRLDEMGSALADGVRRAATGAGAPLVVNQVGSAVQLLWGVSEPVRSYAEARRDDRQKVAALTGRLLDHGIHVGERGLLLLSEAHNDDQIAATIAAFEAAMDELSG